MTGPEDAPTIRVRVNGEPRALRAATSVAELVGVEAAHGVAVARNGEVVPRAEWATTALSDGDEIETVRPVQGG